jgi:hypothetical protein
LRCDNVNHETKPSLLRKLEAILGFMLYLDKRISSRQKVRVHVVAAIRCKADVAALVRGLEGPTYEVTANPDMFRPGHDMTSESQIGPGLEALQSTFFDEFITQPTELKSYVVFAKMRASYHAKVYIGHAGSIAVAMLKAEINHAADDERRQILVCEMCRLHTLGQNIQSC